MNESRKEARDRKREKRQRNEGGKRRKGRHRNAGDRNAMLCMVLYLICGVYLAHFFKLRQVFEGLVEFGLSICIFWVSYIGSVLIYSIMKSHHSRKLIYILGIIRK